MSRKEYQVSPSNLDLQATKNGWEQNMKSSVLFCAYVQTLVFWQEHSNDPSSTALLCQPMASPQHFAWIKARNQTVKLQMAEACLSVYPAPRSAICDGDRAGSCMQIECVPAKAINGWDERLRKERGEHETFVYNNDYGTCAKAHTFTIKSQEFICWGCPNNLAGPEQPSSLNESFVCSTSRHLHASPSFACLNCGSMNSSDVAKRSSWQDPFPVGLRKPTQDLCKLRQMCTFQQSNVPSESITLTGEKIL